MGGNVDESGLVAKLEHDLVRREPMHDAVLGQDEPVLVRSPDEHQQCVA